MRSFFLRLASAALCIVILQPSLHAGEPDGFVRIRPIWIETADPEQKRIPGEISGKRLTLEIEAVVPLGDSKMILSVPQSVTLRPRGTAGSSMRIESPGGGTRRLTLDLGAAVKRAALEIDLEFRPTDGGIATVMVEGRTEDGRSFSEGIGISLGRDSVSGTARNGAIEYPAGTQP